MEMTIEEVASKDDQDLMFQQIIQSGIPYSKDEVVTVITEGLLKLATQKEPLAPTVQDLPAIPDNNNENNENIAVIGSMNDHGESKLQPLPPVTVETTPDDVAEQPEPGTLDFSQKEVKSPTPTTALSIFNEWVENNLLKVSRLQSGENVIICYWRAESPPPSAPVAELKRSAPPPPQTPTQLEAGSKRRRISAPFRSPLILSKGANAAAAAPSAANILNTPVTGARSLAKVTPLSIKGIYSSVPPPFRALSKTLLDSTKTWEGKTRTLDMVIRHHKAEEAEKLDDLIGKWRDACKQALEQLRCSIGPILVSDIYPQQSTGGGWGQEEFRSEQHAQHHHHPSSHPPLKDIDPYEMRLMTLKELCSTLKIDIETIGDYDQHGDCFAGRG